MKERKKERKIKNIRTYYLSNEDFQLQDNIDELAYRERTNLSNIILDALKEYWEKHGDGNPMYTLDQFAEHDEMKAVPAVFRDRGVWDEYLHECDPKLRQEILYQSQTIGALAKKWGKYE